MHLRCFICRLCGNWKSAEPIDCGWKLKARKNFTEDGRPNDSSYYHMTVANRSTQQLLLTADITVWPDGRDHDDNTSGVGGGTGRPVITAVAVAVITTRARSRARERIARSTGTEDDRARRSGGGNGAAAASAADGTTAVHTVQSGCARTPVSFMAANAAYLQAVRARIIFGLSPHRRDVTVAAGGLTRICRTFVVSVNIFESSREKKNPLELLIRVNNIILRVVPTLSGAQYIRYDHDTF